MLVNKVSYLMVPADLHMGVFPDHPICGKQLQRNNNQVQQSRHQCLDPFGCDGFDRFKVENLKSF